MLNKHKNISIILLLISFVLLATIGAYYLTSSKASVAQPADINNDNMVDIFDLSILLANWNKTGTNTSDINGDSVVNIFDLSQLLSKWGAVTVTPTPTVSVNCNTQAWQNLETCGWSGPSNTGYPAGTTFANTTGRTINTNDTIIVGQKISGRLYINAQNVTIRNSWITSTGGGTNGTGVIEVGPGASAIIDHVLIDGGNNAHACVWYKGASLTVKNVNCTKVNDGFFSWQDAGGTTQGNNFTIEDNYIHDLTTATGNGHIDGFQTEGANNGIIRHNTFDINQDQNAAVAIWDGYKSSDTILVDNNLIAGGGFSMYAEDYSPSEASPSGGFSVTNISFTNNKFSRKYFGCIGYWGIWYERGTPTDGWRRTGNTILETGENVDSGNPRYVGASDGDHNPGDICR